MKIVSSITIIAIAFLIPNVFMEHLGAITGGDFFEYEFDHVHHIETTHTHHTHDDSSDNISHHELLGTHSHSIKILPAMSFVFAKHLQLYPIQFLQSVFDKNRNRSYLGLYQSGIRSPKQSLFLSTCVFIL